MKYATRVNSFLRNGNTFKMALKSIGSIENLDYIDLNYPEHFTGLTENEVGDLLKENNLKLNAINMRFRDEYLKGVFTNTNYSIRQNAIQLCIEAGKVCKKLNGTQVIIWLSYDGYDYPFQIDYVEAWRNIKQSVKEVCEAVEVPVSIEYKPYEERVHTFMDSYASTLLMIEQSGCDNLGVTIDVAHMLMKKENPAMAAALLLEKGKLFTVHLNDSEGSADDGLMIGTIHPFKMLELFYYLKKYDYEGIIYFDTFPKRENGIDETKANIAMCKRLESLIDKFGLEKIDCIVQKNDAIAAMEIMQFCLAD